MSQFYIMAQNRTVTRSRGVPSCCRRDQRRYACVLRRPCQLRGSGLLSTAENITKNDKARYLVVSEGVE